MILLKRIVALLLQVHWYWRPGPRALLTGSASPPPQAAPRRRPRQRCRLLSSYSNS